MPMDSYGWTCAIQDYMNNWDELICYTEFGAMDWQAWGCTKAVSVIPHGITAGQFFGVDKAECRKSLGLPQDDFIVFNGNRNQTRKRIDITIDAFARFAIDRPDAKLYLHGLKGPGLGHHGAVWQADAPLRNGSQWRIIMNGNHAQPPNVGKILNIIYNACDVGVNTCKGESWSGQSRACVALPRSFLTTHPVRRSLRVLASCSL